MTIKDFSEKYHVPYYLAYEASFGVKPGCPDGRCKEFSEQEMVDNLLKIMSLQMNKNYQRMQRIHNKITEVRNIAGRTETV